MRQFLTRALALSLINGAISMGPLFLTGWMHTLVTSSDAQLHLTSEGLITMIYFVAVAFVFTVPIASVALLVLDKSKWETRHKYVKVSMVVWFVFGMMLSAPGAWTPMHVNLLWSLVSGALVGYLFTAVSRKYEWP